VTTEDEKIIAAARALIAHTDCKPLDTPYTPICWSWAWNDLWRAVKNAPA
jgi:hypothetical protein